MSQVLDDLVELLTLEAIEENLFAAAVRTWVFASCLAARCWGSRCLPPVRPSKRTATFTRCTAISCALAMQACRWSTKWTACVTAAVSARVA